MSERLNKTSICCIVFLDIVAYSQKSDSEQLACKDRFNRLIGDAIKDVAQNDRIILDTGDGAAIAMMGSPEDAVFVSMTIRDGILKGNREHPETPLFVRIGINLGPVRVVKDINGQMSIIGDGINVAQRIMSFTEPNHILVSRSYYEIVSRLSDELTQIFTYSGIKHDKHVREHEVYAIRQAAGGSATSDDVDVMMNGDGRFASNAARHSRTRLAIGGGCLLLLIAGGLLIAGAKSPAKAPSPAAAQSQLNSVASSVSTNSKTAAPQATKISPSQESAMTSPEAGKASRHAGEKIHKSHEPARKLASTAPVQTAPKAESAATLSSQMQSPPAELAKVDVRNDQQKPVSQHHPSKHSTKDSVECSSAMRSLNQCH
jgi:class 3 adenylate cyclase